MYKYCAILECRRGVVEHVILAIGINLLRPLVLFPDDSCVGCLSGLQTLMQVCVCVCVLRERSEGQTRRRLDAIRSLERGPV